MSLDSPPWRRRSMLAGLASLASLPVLPRASRAQSALDNLFAGDRPAILVASPEASQAGHWARKLQPSLSIGLMTSAALTLNFAGGPDGVTGANQFDANTPDGDDALLLPGTAALAALAGDTRVRFDLSDMIAVLAATTPGLLMLRGGLGSHHKSAPLRVACAATLTPSLTGLLGLHLLGIDARPAAVGTACAVAARAGTIDAVFITGDDVPGQQQKLQEAGLVPGFAVTLTAPGAPMVRDTRLASVPALPELLAPQVAASPLTNAWRAVASASVLQMALTLTPLSGAWVTRWRHAAAQSLATPDVIQAASARAIRFVDGAAAGTAILATQADPAAELALRRWLGSQLNWRPV